MKAFIAASLQKLVDLLPVKVLEMGHVYSWERLSEEFRFSQVCSACAGTASDRQP